MFNNDSNTNPLEATGATVTGPTSISEFRDIYLTPDVATDPTAYAVKIMLALGIDSHGPSSFSMTDDNIARNKATALSMEEMDALVANSFDDEIIGLIPTEELTLDQYWAQWEETVEEFTEADLLAPVDEDAESEAILDMLMESFEIDEIATNLETVLGRSLTETDLFNTDDVFDYEALEKTLDALPEVVMDPESFYNFEKAQDWCRNILEHDAKATCNHGKAQRDACVYCYMEDNY